jgi:hypothetical protein
MATNTNLTVFGDQQPVWYINTSKHTEKMYFNLNNLAEGNYTLKTVIKMKVWAVPGLAVSTFYEVITQEMTLNTENFDLHNKPETVTDTSAKTDFGLLLPLVGVAAIVVKRKRG